MLPRPLVAALAAGPLAPPLAAWAVLRFGRSRSPVDADVLVLPGAKVWDDRPSPALTRRIDGVAALWHAGRAPRIVVSGAGREAELSAAGLVARGVPEPAILHEPLARTTAENASRTAALIGPDPHVLVVTCDAHAARCLLLFGRHFARVSVVGVTSPGTPWRFALREAAAVSRLLVTG